MNILMLAEVSAATVIGGAERVLREEALGLRRRGHTVAVVARAPAGDPRSCVDVEGIAEYRYAVARGNEAAFVLSTVKGSLRTFDMASAGGADAVIIHQSLAGFGPILRRRMRAAAWVYVCHSLAQEEYLTRTTSGLNGAAKVRRAVNAWMRLRSEREVMRRCGRIVVLSHFMKQKVMAAHRMPQESLTVVNGGADPVRFRPAADRAALRQELDLPGGKVLLFTVRNLVPRMGLENLIQSISLLGDESRTLLLLIGGEGPLRGALQALISELNLSDRVRLLGFVPESRLPRYYQAVDLVVMPTFELEGFGLVTVEAMAAGTPVLGTPVGALPEILAQVDPILIADGTDAGALAKGISRVLTRFRDRPEELARLSLQGRALVEKEYNWDRHCERLEEILQDVRRDASRLTPYA